MMKRFRSEKAGLVLFAGDFNVQKDPLAGSIVKLLEGKSKEWAARGIAILNSEYEVLESLLKAGVPGIYNLFEA
jgi:hypothetical protein